MISEAGQQQKQGSIWTPVKSVSKSLALVEHQLFHKLQQISKAYCELLASYSFAEYSEVFHKISQSIWKNYWEMTEKIKSKKREKEKKSHAKPEKQMLALKTEEMLWQL